MRRFPFKLVCSSIQFESSVHQALIHQGIIRIIFKHKVFIFQMITLFFFVKSIGPNHVYPYEERLPLTSATSTVSSHFVANKSCLECANHHRRDVSVN